MCERCFAPLFAVEHFQNTGWSARNFSRWWKKRGAWAVNCVLEVFQFVADEPLARKIVLTTFSEQSQLTWETTSFCRFAVSQNWSAIHFDEKICKNRDQNFDIIICSIRTGASPNNNNIQGKPPFFLFFTGSILIYYFDL